MRKHAMVVLGVAAIGFMGFAVYYSRKKAAPASATQGQPINSLPARAYAQNFNYNPQSQPPSPTFTPFSGLPVYEAPPSTLDTGLIGISPGEDVYSINPSVTV